MSYQEKFQHGVSQFDKELSKYPLLVNLERQTGAPKAYVVGGILGFYFILVAFNVGGQTLTNLAGFIVPGYYSLGTLFSQNKLDDTQQWVTYWMVFAFFSLLESIFSVTYWIPFYYAAKLVVLLWAGLPQTSGGRTLFSFLAPVLAKYFVAPSFSSASLRSRADAAVAGGDKTQ
ncbi:TB2/DP1, HVA22 family-domain-containing protein [Kalaharituber pfeilii]|nr:TB2/DP1, HVA22 family-domain-containing protein [Kalaharituber pfeilii]